MNPLALLTLAKDNWQLVVAGILIAGNILFYNLWQHEKAEYIAYGAGVEALGKQALEDKATTEAEHKQNLEDVKNDFEKTLPDVRAGAVAAYLAAHRVPDVAGRGAMPGIAPRQQANDGAGQERLSAPETCQPDKQFIEDSADDASKVEEWRAYCTRNHCPVEE